MIARRTSTTAKQTETDSTIASFALNVEPETFGTKTHDKELLQKVLKLE